MTFVPRQNMVSVANSTADLLTSGSSFVGTAEDVSQYDSVVVSAKTDQSGFYTIEFSVDGINWDSSLKRYYRLGQIEPPHRFTITRQFCRISFTNTSASDQTFLRLQTIFGSKTPFNVSLDSNLSQDYDAAATRPSLARHEIALGRRQGHTAWNKFGLNSDIDTGVPEVVASFGGTHQRLDVASTFTVVSDSTEDTLTTGTGAWNVIIYYVDENRMAQEVVVPLDGTNPVATVVTGLGINRAALFNTGSADSNVGTITITATTGGSTQAEIPVGHGTTQQCIFFTQAEHTTLIDEMLYNAVRITGGGGADPQIVFRMWVYSYVSNAKYLGFRSSVDTARENTITITFDNPLVVGEQSIIWLEAESDKDNTSVNCRFNLVEVRNNDAA